MQMTLVPTNCCHTRHTLYCTELQDDLCYHRQLALHYPPRPTTPLASLEILRPCMALRQSPSLIWQRAPENLAGTTTPTTEGFVSSDPWATFSCGTIASRSKRPILF